MFSTGMWSAQFRINRVRTIKGHKLEEREVLERLGAFDVVAYVETLLVSPPVWTVQRPVGSWLGPPARLASRATSFSLAVFFRLTLTLSVVIVLVIVVAIVVVGPRLTGVAGMGS